MWLIGYSMVARSGVGRRRMGHLVDGVVERREAFAQGVEHCLCAAIKIELAQNVADMRADGCLADLELVGNPLITPAACRQPKDGHLALRQGLRDRGLLRCVCNLLP